METVATFSLGLDEVDPVRRAANTLSFGGIRFDVSGAVDPARSAASSRDLGSASLLGTLAVLLCLLEVAGQLLTVPCQG